MKTPAYQVVADVHAAIATSYAWSMEEADEQAEMFRQQYGNAEIRTRDNFVPDYDEDEVL